jgi:hypothetical protein
MVDTVTEYTSADLRFIAIIFGECQEIFAGEIDPELADMKPAGDLHRKTVPDA